MKVSLHSCGDMNEIIYTTERELNFSRTRAGLPIWWPWDLVHLFIKRADHFHDPRCGLAESVVQVLILDLVEVNFHPFSFLAKPVALQDLFG